MNKSTVVVYLTAGLGDFVIALPTIYSLRRKYPKEKIIFVTSSSSNAKTRKLISGYTKLDAPFWIDLINGFVDEIIVLNLKNKLKDIKELNMRIERSTIKKIYVLTYDDTKTASRLKKLFFFFASFKIFSIRGIFNGFLRYKIEKNKGDQTPYIYHKSIQLLKNVWKSDDEINTILADFRRTYCPLFLKNYTPINSYDVFGSINVAIGAGSLRQHKQWGLEKYSYIANKLLDGNTGVKIFLFGAKKDNALINLIKSEHKERVIDLCGSSIKEVLFYMHNCRIFLGNDGGTAHLASLSPIPIFTITPGIEKANTIEPLFNIENSIRHYTECSPCLNTETCPKEKTFCMINIDEQKVLTKIAPYLKQ